MLFYMLGNNNQTDQGDKTEGLEREGLGGGGSCSLLNNMTTRELCHTFADFFPCWDFLYLAISW
jgi:hypothetical protein